MNITPKDVLDKEFRKKLNGYDPEQVDEFLDDIIKQFESLLEENEEVIVKNEALKSEIARLKQKTEKIEQVEEKLMAAVSTAQRNATMYVENAEAQAKKITEIANQNAKTVIQSTHLRMEGLAAEIKKYEKVITDFKQNFKSFLDDQSVYVDTRLTDDESLTASAADISKSINELTKQIKQLGGQPVEDDENASYHLNDILSEAQARKVGEDPATAPAPVVQEAELPQREAPQEIQQQQFQQAQQPQVQDQQQTQPQAVPAGMEQSEYNLRQSTANLQDIVNEIIDN